jgi:hypothetical protein
VSVAFRALVPTDLKTLSIDKVLAFRETFPNERHRFQTAVDGLLKNRTWLLSIDDLIESLFGKSALMRK